MEYKNTCQRPPLTLLMKVTSRQRPTILLETVRQYIEMAEDTRNMVWLFSFDEDDESCRSAEFTSNLQNLIEPTGTGMKSLCVWGKSSYKIEAINRDINNEHFKAHWDILLNISDDQRPIVKGYDNIIRRAMPDDLDASLWFSDGQPRVNTQEIIGRSYYNRFGYIYHPDYKSLWCDNESTEAAYRLGKQIKSSQQIVRHIHPAWGGSYSLPNDTLYERNNKFWNEDEATFKRRQLINFDLK